MTMSCARRAPTYPTMPHMPITIVGALLPQPPPLARPRCRDKMVAMSSSPYVELDRAAWAALAKHAHQPLTPTEVARVRGLGDELDVDEVRQVYLPLSELLSLYVRHTGALHRATETFLRQPQEERTPFVIGIAGSVAVGKSTTARLLKELLSRWPQHPKVELVTTDGF